MHLFIGVVDVRVGKGSVVTPREGLAADVEVLVLPVFGLQEKNNTQGEQNSMVSKTVQTTDVLSLLILSL